MGIVRNPRGGREHGDARFRMRVAAIVHYLIDQLLSLRALVLI